MDTLREIDLTPRSVLSRLPGTRKTDDERLRLRSDEEGRAYLGSVAALSLLGTWRARHHAPLAVCCEGRHAGAEAAPATRADYQEREGTRAPPPSSFDHWHADRDRSRVYYRQRNHPCSRPVNSLQPNSIGSSLSDITLRCLLPFLLIEFCSPSCQRASDIRNERKGIRTRIHSSTNMDVPSSSSWSNYALCSRGLW